ncbi:MAG: hypothetical protein EPO40_25435 [Myxococcaceae bacterium]|nr:MAG: hypothetical protein EPO40_25435 [Myxococcaceae bacterium]
MNELRTPDLVIEVREEEAPPTLVLSWRGRSADRYPAQVLGPFFAEALERAAALGATVEMRFHALEHFNSSTITAVIELIQDARGCGVRLVIAYDGSVKWQRLSFDALRVFNRGDALLELRPS